MREIVPTLSVWCEHGQVVIQFTPDSRNRKERHTREVRLPWSWPLVDSINHAVGVHADDVTTCLATQSHGIIVTFWFDSL